jgi:RIO-like serine/threonine protein kinase
MYDGSSEFYVPYYFTKFCNQHVIIREFVEGVQLNDAKGLKELGLVPEVAYAHVLSEVHHLLRKFKTISGSLNEKNILLRKYIKPYKPAATE